MFITFEGLDGGGKTTQINLLRQYLDEQDYAVVYTREPGGTPIGDEIREILHSLKNKAMNPRTEMLLYIASRAQLVAQVIQPELQKGSIVICDRYADSTIAYQGYGHGLDLDILRRTLDFATQGLKPDLSIFLDVSADLGLQRRQKAAEQGEEFNRMDDFALEFYLRVQNGYETLIDEEPDRWLKIKAQDSIDSIQQQIRTAVMQRLETTA